MTNDVAEHSVFDGSRELRFVGCLLATASSEAPGKSRWAEFELYRTQSGKYVLAGIGRSVLRGEVDKRWAQVSDEPGAVVERLTMYDDKDARYLPTTAQTLLTRAGLLDEGIRGAFSVQFID